VSESELHAADARPVAQVPSRRALLGIGAALAVGAAWSETAVPSPAGAASTAALPAAATEPAATATTVAAARRSTAHRGKQYARASTAAKKAGASRSKLFPGDRPEAHLLRRATFGARPSDVAELKRLGIDDWIDKQLSPGSFRDPRGDRAWNLFPLAGARPATIVAKSEQFSWDAVYATAQASLARQIFSDRQLYEIVVDIFANHLHVPLPGEQWHTAPSYIRDVIRKNALGSFTTMLLAAMKHPAMLDFLNNDESRKANVNENLGRELLELHTVGVRAKFTEADVRASAAILSGRTWDWEKGTYRYDPSEHVTGRVKVLGFTHANKTGGGGEAVGDAYVRYLARHPSTARSIARKIAVRFVSDDPSPHLVDRLARVYLKHDTSIRATVQAVFRSSDFWDAVGTRMRRPLEDAVGTMRVLDVQPAAGMRTPISWLYWNLDQAGHTPHGWAPPNGYPDAAADWLGAGAMIQRWNLHRTFVYGWWDHLDYVKPSKLVPRTKKMTTLAWTRAVSQRILGVVPSKRHLIAVIRGARLSPGSPAPLYDWDCGKIAALLLDSPYFQLR
jgi:uncharacterized protein (DUF1800 family)